VENLLIKHPKQSSTIEEYSVEICLLFHENRSWTSPYKEARTAEHDKPVLVDHFEGHRK
jgi:hypothetical protein